jgi:hypothetical protein
VSDEAFIPIIKFEVSIPVDDKRNVWMTGTAEKVPVSKVGDVTAMVGKAVSDQALATFDQAVPPSELEDEAARIVREAKNKGGGAEEVPPSQRRPRPEDPDSMRTFGEDDEDENP